MLELRLKSNPGDADAMCFLSRVRLSLGAVDSGVDLIERAIALKGRKAEFLAQAAVAHGMKAQNSGMISAFRLARKARSEAEEAAGLDPTNTRSRWFLLEFHLQAPGVVGGDKKKLPVLANQLMAVNQLEGHLAFARLASEEKNLAREEEQLKAAVASASSSERALCSLANFYIWKRKDYESGKRHAAEAVKAQPHRAGPYVSMAAALAFAKSFQDLDKLLGEAEKDVPNNFVPYFQAGTILLNEGSDFARAERYFRKYLSQPPEGGAPKAAHAHWRLGLVLEKLNRKPEAAQQMQACLKLEPEFEPAKKDLKRMK